MVKHPLLANTLAGWGARGREIVVITSQETGEVMENISGKALLARVRQWGMQLLMAIDYLQTNKLSPVDLCRSTILLTDDSLVLSDILFTQNLSNLRLDSSLLEDLLVPEMDQVSFAVVLVELAVPELAPLQLVDVVRDIQEGRASKLIDRVQDDRLKDVLSKCLCPVSARWSVRQLMEHPLFRQHLEDLDQDSLSPLSSPFSPQASVGPSREDLCAIIDQLGGQQTDLSMSLVIDTEDGKLKVSFTFSVGKDSPDGVAEELIHELGASQKFIQETASVIRRKMIEKGRKTEDLLVLSPRIVIDSGLKDDEVDELLQRQKEEEAKMLSSHERERTKFVKQQTELHESRVHRGDQSCPSLIDIVPLIKPIKSGSDLKSLPEFERSNSRKGTGKHAVVPVPSAVYLKKAVEGNDAAVVKQLQEALNLVLGEDLKVDGQFGKKTEHVVKKFQEQEGLPVTGIVESVTWSSLVSEYSKKWKTEDRAHTDYIS